MDYLKYVVPFVKHETHRGNNDAEMLADMFIRPRVTQIINQQVEDAGLSGFGHATFTPGYDKGMDLATGEHSEEWKATHKGDRGGRQQHQATRRAVRDVARHQGTEHMKGTVARDLARTPYLRRLQAR